MTTYSNGVEVSESYVHSAITHRVLLDLLVAKQIMTEAEKAQLLETVKGLLLDEITSAYSAHKGIPLPAIGDAVEEVSNGADSNGDLDADGNEK